MLFDLRGRGRRRTVQTIYLGLAALMALGLIGFGVGSGLGGGGVAEVLTKKEGTGGASFAAQVEEATKRAKRHPSDPAAWQALAQARLKEAGGPEFYDSNTGLYTAKGKIELRAASEAWTHYLQLNPKSTPYGLADTMANVYSEEGLNEPASAVQALEIVVEDRPESLAAYGALAKYAYLAHNIQQGDLASKKAVALAPKARRPLLELEFEKMKKAAAVSTVSSLTSSTASAGASSSAGSAGASSSAGSAGASSGAGSTGSHAASTPTKSGSTAKK